MIGGFGFIIELDDPICRLFIVDRRNVEKVYDLGLGAIPCRKKIPYKQITFLWLMVYFIKYSD